MGINVISLKRCKERRDALTKKFKYLNYEAYCFFDAVDARIFTNEYVEKINAKVSDLTNEKIKRLSFGEIGCSLSHLNLYKYLVENKVEYTVVIEDDVDFNQDLLNFIKEVSDNKDILNDFDLILLGYSSNAVQYNLNAKISYWGRRKVKKYLIGRPARWYWGSFAYLITLEGATKLLKAGFPLRMQADCLLINSTTYDVKLGIVHQPLVEPSELNDSSEIGDRDKIDFDRIFQIKKILKYPKFHSSLKAPKTFFVKLSILEYYIDKILSGMIVHIRKFHTSPSKFFSQDM